MTGFDTSNLTPTSSKRDFAWRDTRVGLVIVAADGTIDWGWKIPEKLALLERAADSDCVLAVRSGAQRPPHPDVLAVDDREKALEVLSR